MWFVPGLMVLGAMAVAEGVVAIERAAGSPSTGAALGVEGSRGILVAIGGSALAVAATMFSITMSVIATASSTYGPRLVRNFMADRHNQQVLGVFLATFVYCLLILRNVEDPGGDAEPFVPQLAVHLAIGLALVCVAALVYFLHHIAHAIQVPTLVRRVRDELEEAAETLYGDEARASRARCEPLPDDSTLATAHRAGFVTSVDTAGLVGAAAACDGVIDLIARPGDHVILGEPLARIAGGSGDSDHRALADAVRQHLHVAEVRTPGQDIEFALQQLVEMAVRAVSPSMNDPYTARNAIDELACGLVPAMTDPAPLPGWTDRSGIPRLRWPPPSGVELVDVVYDDVRNYAASDPLVVRGALRLAARLLAEAGPTTRERIHRQVDELLAAAERSGMASFDLERLATERERLCPAPRST